MQKSSAVIGQKGVKYGLQQRAGAKKVAGAPARPANVFGDDSDSEEDVAVQVARQAEKKKAAAKVQQMYEEALMEDPSVFDYDGVYDSMQQAAVQPKIQDKLQRQSRYIAQLKEQAEHRKRVQDLSYERRLLKERQQEDHLFEDKEKFVTSAYRKKLEEDKKWLELEKQREEEEQRSDVRKVGHMGNFYKNLLNKNVAFGTAEQQPATQSLQQSAEGSHGKHEPGAESKDASASGDQKSSKLLSQLDQYDRMRLEAERSYRAHKASGTAGDQQQREESLPPDDRMDAAPRASAAVPEPEPVHAQQGMAGVSGRPPSMSAMAGSAERGEGGGEAEGGEPAAGGGGKRRNDDSAVLSARERYLARKAQKTS